MSGFAGFVTHRAVEAIGWGLVHSVWQLALLALAFAGVRLALRKRSPAARYALACVMLAIMAVVPLATTWAVWSRVESSPNVAAARLAPSEPSVVVSRAEPTDVMRREPTVEATPPGILPDSVDAAIGSPEQPSSEATMGVEGVVAPTATPAGSAAPIWLATIREWLPWLVAGWLLGVAGFSARLACGFVGTRRLRREATSPVSAAIEDVLGHLAGRLGVRRAVRLVESALVEVPTLVGHLRPIILLPAAMLTGLTPRQLEAVLAHELAHVRRHDYLLNWIQTAIETVLFYHPAVWWVSREIRQERENCCDDLALSVCDDRIVYARALARVAELRSGRYRSAVAETAVAATGGSLLDRIRRIVGPPAEGPTRRHAWLAGMLLLGVVLVATIGLMGVASGAAETGQNDAAEDLQTELVFWHMIVDRVTADRIAGQTTPAADGMKQDVDIASSQLLETLRKVEVDGSTVIPVKMQWAEPPESRRTPFLHMYDSRLEDIKDTTVRRNHHMSCTGEYKVSRDADFARVDLDFGVDAYLNFHLLDAGGNMQYKLPDSDRKLKWTGQIAPSHARIFIRPIEENGNRDYCYVIVAQAAAVPKDLAEYIRSCNVTSRWLARGVEGALDDIRSALEWEKAAGPRADAATDSPACYTTPDGKWIEVVAIGRPAKWPHRWWDMEGRPVQANPAWHKYAAGGALALVVRRDNQTDTTRFSIETPGIAGSWGVGSAGSSEFGPGESLYYLTDASGDGALSKYLDEGGEVRLSVKHGTGDWTEIATIKEGQEVKADGGRFALTKVDDRRSKHQPGLLGRIVGESERPGLLLVDGRYDYDPAFEIQLAAVDAQGKRTMGPATTGSDLFERDKDRRWFGHIQIDKADVDHFAILKRPVVGHVFEKIPAKPEAAPDQADMDTPSEPSPEAGHENTDQSLPPRSISGRVTDADGKPIAGASVEWGYILDPPAQWQGTKTESDGRYSLKLTAYGVGYRLGVSAPGKAPQWQLFYPPWSHVSKTPIPDKDAAPPETIDFALEPAHRLTGIVLDEQSQPIAGVWITARTSYDRSISSFWGPEWATPIPGGVYATNTGGDGRFTLEGLPAEEVSLTLESPHRHVNEQSYAVDRKHVIKMTGSGRPGTLRGVVVDATTGKPIPQFQVAIRYCPEKQAFYSKEGHFTWSGELTEGRQYETHVHAKGYAPRKLKMKAGPVDHLEPSRVELEPARPLLGRLVDTETGKPLSGVSVYYGVTIDECSGQIEWDDLDKILRGSMGFDAVQRATTDLRGEFWFCEAKGGPKGTLIVQAEGHGRLILPPANRPATQPDQPLEIGLRPEATISGVLPGAPADAQVVVQKLEPTYEKIRESIEYRPVDAAGRFRIGNLAPGKYQVSRIVKPNRSSSTFEPIATVTVTAGEHEQLDATEGDTHSRKPEETRIENPVLSLRTTVFPPGSLVAAGAEQAPPSTRPITAVEAEPIDPAEVRRKIAALGVPDQTVPLDEQAERWLYQRRKQIMPQLIAGLTEKNPTVAGQCLNILRDVPASKELTETLIAIAGDERSPLRQEVLRRLEPSAADPRVARLLDQAGDDAKSFADPVTRARWLGLAGRKDRAVELLKPMLAEPGKSSWDTVQAIRLLGEMREPAGIDVLEPIAAGGNWGMAVEAYKALAQIDPKNHGLTDDQRTLLDGARRYMETEEQLRRRIDGLAKLNPEETRPLVMQMLRDTDHAAQYPALLILTAWKDKEALPGILELVQGDNRSYHQQQAVAAYLSIDESPQAEKDVLDRLGTFGFGQSGYFEAVLRGIATAEMPDARKVAMLRAAGYNPQVPGAVPYAVGYMAGRGHDVGGILVPLMLEEKNLQPMARYCTVAASDKARRFGPLVGRAMRLLMSEPTIAAGGEKTTVSTAEAATLILDAVAVYDLKESAADVQKLANSRNAIIRNAAQAAGAKLGVPGTVNDLYVQLKSDDANVRRLAARSLLDIKPADEQRRAEREAFVLSCLGTPSEDHAMRVLTTCGGQKAVEALEPILDDPDAQRAVYAAWVLAQLPDEKAAAKALRRVAIFAMFHHQLYQQGAGIDFDIAPELRFHQVTQRLNPDPNAYSGGEGPVRIPNELLRPFDLDEAEQAYAVRCYQRAEGVHEIGRFTLHFLERIGRPGPAGYHSEGPTVLNQTYLPLLRAMAAGDPRLERLMVEGRNVAHFKYRQWAAQAIARITQEAASYTGLGGETLDSGAFPKPYADQDRLLARFFVDRLERAKIPDKQPQSDREYRQQDYFYVTANQLCDQFGPGTIDAIRQEAGRRKISVERVLPRITTPESFDRVEVTIDGMWRERRRLLIQGDGHQAVYSVLARRPNEPVAEHTQTFQLGDDRRAELGRLLSACQSFGAETSPGATDIDQYTLTVTVGGAAREHRFHGFGKSPYADMARFLASLDEQEYLYYRLSGDDARYRLEAARQLYDDLSARMGHRSRTPSPRLDQIDYVRFEPIFTDWLVRYNDRKDDELSAAIAWVGYLKRKDLFMHVAALKDKGAQSDWDVLCETLVRLDDPRSLEILSELAGKPFRCEHAVFALIRSGKPGIEMLKKRLEEAVPPAYEDASPERRKHIVELWELNERIVRVLMDNWDRLEASSEIHASLAPVVARMIEARNRGRWSHHGMRTEYYEQYVRLPSLSPKAREELGKMQGTTPAERGPSSPYKSNASGESPMPSK